MVDLFKVIGALIAAFILIPPFLKLFFKYLDWLNFR